MDDIYNRFRDFVLSNGLILPGEKILLSLSAGKDSMFMLHLIMKLQHELNFAIGIFHLNHLTRAEESDRDELFVRAKAEELNVPCYIEKFDFKKNKEKSKSFEEHARDIRYSLLEKIMQMNSFSKIATAHNMNDNAETIMMRVLSGTGIAGLKGILPVSGNIIRPVLFADKKEIYSCLKKNSIQWREDHSNIENIYLRNYMRNIIIPAAEERFPSAEINLNNLAAHAIENQLLLNNLIDKLYPSTVIKNEAETIIDIDSFREDMPLIKFFISRVLYEMYGIKMKISLHREILRRLLNNSANVVLYQKGNLLIRKCLLNDKTVISITDSVEVQKTGVNWEYSISIVGGNTVYLSEIDKEIRISFVDYDFYNSNKNNPDMIFIQSGDDIENLIVRNRRPGDRIKIESGTKKIKELMIEKKLDTKTKNSVPIIVADNQIAAYLPGLVNSNNNRVACNFHIRNDTKRILAFFFMDN